jgi:hypothetical protein
MKRLLLIALCALPACGGFENEPFKTGIVRGQLSGVDATALISVVDHEELVTRPDAEGRFELAGVPLGNVELLAIINARQSRRLAVTVAGATVVELGAVEAKPSAKFEIYVSAAGGLRLTGGTVSLVGTPLRVNIRGSENEAEFYVPGGCYTALVQVPGLAEATTSGCIGDSGFFERRVELSPPDGSPGQEGCAVTGCLTGLTCQVDRTCR